MASIKRGAIRTLVLVCALIFAPRAFAAGPDVLTPWDARLYKTAFEAAERGDFKTADEALERVKDPVLAGQVQLIKIMHPTAFKAGYDDLSGWLKDYSDQAGAERVYGLAVKRKPASAAAPKSPVFLDASRSWTRVETASVRIAGPSSPDRSFAARDAYYSGNVERAYALAPAAGERWVAGLAAWRLSKFSESRKYFEAIARDEGEDDWVRSAGAFWAARAAEVQGDQAAAQGLLRIAVRNPQTFYGMIADRKLRLEQAELGAPPPMLRADPNHGLLIRASNTTPVPIAGGLIQSDARARRAAALMQVGRPVEAGQELRVGLALARNANARSDWSALVLALNAPLTSAADAPPAQSVRRGPAKRYVKEDYPVPELYPAGGFTLNKGLVYAFVRQESRFNPYAVSSAGAVGLMQLRPAAAARAAGDDKLSENIIPLFDGPTNLRIGQDHIVWLMERGLGGGPEAYDLLRVVAAYNAGAGTVLKTVSRAGPDADSLLIMESLPAGQTREYVEKVVAAYWVYQGMFNGGSATLDALARGDKIVDMRLDR